MRSVRKTKSKYRVLAKDRLLTHKGHGDDVADALSAVVENAAFADVKVSFSCPCSLKKSHYPRLPL